MNFFNFRIYGFMIDTLSLTGNTLLVYALLFSFTLHSSDGCYYGSQSTVASRLGLTRQSVSKCIKSLKNKGLIEEKIIEKNNKKYTALAVKDIDTLSKELPYKSKELTPLSTDLTFGCKESLHNNNNYNNSYNNNDNDIYNDLIF